MVAFPHGPFLVSLLFASVAAGAPECEEIGMLQASANPGSLMSVQGSDARPKTADEKEAEELAKEYKRLEPLKAVAGLLAKAKFHCRHESTEQCLPTLKEYRLKIWPKIEAELGKKLTMFEPTGLKSVDHVDPDWHPFYLQVNLTGCRNRFTYMHVKQTPGKSILATLEKYAERDSIRRTMRDGKSVCNLEHKDGNRVAFAFVRNPLTRFVEAYGHMLTNAPTNAPKVKPGIQIVSGMSLLQKETSTARARRFVENFLQGAGESLTGTLVPQSEYFAPVGDNCSIKVGVVVKEEKKQKEWKMLLEKKGCNASEMPFLLKEVPRQSTHPLLFQTSSSLSSSSTTVMEEALSGKDGLAYLRAFCWFSLPDYFMLDYQLPEKCMETDMSMVVDWAWTWKVVPTENQQ